MTIILFDTPQSHQRLYPLSLTKAVCDIRHGLYTPREWYSIHSSCRVAALSAPYLTGAIPEDEIYLCIQSAIVPNARLLSQIMTLKNGEMLEDNHGIIAWKTQKKPTWNSFPIFFETSFKTENVQRINHPIDFVRTNAAKIVMDLEGKIDNHQSLPEGNGNFKYGSFPVLAEEGAIARSVVFNTEEGPVFLGKNARVFEGTCIRGPVCISEGAIIKMGSQIYQGTTIGKFAMAGGEIKNSIIGDYSNKAHFGYLGDSILGQWCNLGAGTSNSNVKNNAGNISMWCNLTADYIKVGQKAGMVMGDFSRTAIHTAINSGSTIGVCCSIHGGQQPNKNIPSFTWGLSERYDYKKAMADIRNWYAFKNKIPEPDLEGVLHNIYLNISAA